MNFIENIFEQLETGAEKPLVIEMHGCQERSSTGRELLTLIGKARATLRIRGVRPGDRVVETAPSALSHAHAGTFRGRRRAGS